MTAAQELDAWFAHEKEYNGLVDIKLVCGNLDGATVESMSEEMLKIIKAPKSRVIPKGF